LGNPILCGKLLGAESKCGAPLRHSISLV